MLCTGLAIRHASSKSCCCTFLPVLSQSVRLPDGSSFVALCIQCTALAVTVKSLSWQSCCSLNPLIHKCVTLFRHTKWRRERGFWSPITPDDHIFSISSVSTGWAAFSLLPRPFCFRSFLFMDSIIVETSSNSMAEDFSRLKLTTAGGHGRSRKYRLRK